MKKLTLSSATKVTAIEPETFRRGLRQQRGGARYDIRRGEEHSEDDPQRDARDGKSKVAHLICARIERQQKRRAERDAVASGEQQVSFGQGQPRRRTSVLSLAAVIGGRASASGRCASCGSWAY